MKAFRFSVLVIILAGCGINSIAVADDNPQKIVKYRHAIMEAMSSHALAIQMIATNQASERQFLQGHADSITSLSAELNLLFPAGSGGNETEALPAIWTEQDKFAAAITKMQDTASALSEAAGSNDNKAFMAAFAAAGKACKGCHESFRAEEDEDDSDNDH